VRTLDTSLRDITVAANAPASYSCLYGRSGAAALAADGVSCHRALRFLTAPENNKKIKHPRVLIIFFCPHFTQSFCKGFLFIFSQFGRCRTSF
jgi:hypothetical protein